MSSSAHQLVELSEEEKIAALYDEDLIEAFKENQQCIEHLLKPFNQIHNLSAYPNLHEYSRAYVQHIEEFEYAMKQWDLLRFELKRREVGENRYFCSSCEKEVYFLTAKNGNDYCDNCNAGFCDYAEDL